MGIQRQEVILCGAPVVFLDAQSASFLSLLTGPVEIGGRGVGAPRVLVFYIWMVVTIPHV